MLIQHASTASTGAHPLAGTAAEYVWLLAVLPLVGFLVNGLLALIAAYRPGPSDPTTEHDGHDGAHGGARGAAHASDADAHTTGGGATGDNRHPPTRHRFAAVV